MRGILEMVSSKKPGLIAVTVMVALAVAGVIWGAQAGAHRVSVHAWDREVALNTRAATVEEVLSSINLELSEGDLLEPPKETQVTDDMQIRIERAKPVFVQVKGNRFPVFTAEKSVSAILSVAKVELEQNNLVTPELGQDISDDRLVKVVAVTYGEVSEEQSIPYDTQKREDGSLDIGLTQVYSQGASGLLSVTYEVKYEDGVEVSRLEKDRVVIKDPSPSVVLVGSRQIVSRGGQDIGFSRAIEVSATAYCPCAKCCGSSAVGKTATGIPAAKGVVAVDPRVIPLGSKVYVDGYGYAVAADVGSAIKQNRIDVCFDTHEEALAWGLKKTKIYILR